MGKFIDIVLAGVIAAAAVIFVNHFAGRIEGQIAPVVTDTEIGLVERVDDNSVIVWGLFFLHRAPECEFLDVEWWLVTPTRRTLVKVEFIEKSKVRENGWNTFGPWRVSMSEAELLESSEAFALHSCNPIYTTISRFF